MYIHQLVDIVSCRVKYEEGFVQIGPGRIITKPELLWTKADKDIIIPTDYSICIGFSLQTYVVDLCIFLFLTFQIEEHYYCCNVSGITSLNSWQGQGS